MFGYTNPQTYTGNPVTYNTGQQQQDLQQLGTAATAYANSHYSLAAAAYAQYSQAAQQAASIPGYGMTTDYDSIKYSYPTYADYANAFKSSTGPVSGYKPGNVPDNKGKNPMHQMAQNVGHFQGFDSTVTAAASSYIAAKSAGKGNTWMGASKGGFQKKRFGLGHQGNANTTQYFCEVCKVGCPGTQAWQAHLEGSKAHKKKEAAQKANTTSAALNIPPGMRIYRCEVCEIDCTSRDTYDAHMKGQKHTKKVQLLMKLNKPIPVMIEPEPPTPKAASIPTVQGGNVSKKVVGVTGTKFVGGAKLVTTQSGAIELNSMDQQDDSQLAQQADIKPVGEEFIEEEYHPTTGKFIKYRCKLCDCEFTDLNAKNIHLKGRRHRLQYKSKVNPELDVEIKYNQWSKRQQIQKMPNKPKQQMVPVMQQLRPLFPMNRSATEMDDMHVVYKVQQIQMSSEELQAIEKLVTLIEKALKKVSDTMAEEGTQPEEAKPETEKERMLKGVMRVGYLAKNLLLKTDTEVDLVVLCSEPPTLKLLQKIVEMTMKHAEVSESETLSVDSKPEQSALIVSISSVLIKCRVTLTCVTLREQDGGSVPASIVEKQLDALPLQPCLNALAELRHAKFYQVKCAPLHSINITLKVARDICGRVVTWSQLSPWALELLVEKTLASLAMPLSPGDSIRRLFEVIASGILLSSSRTSQVQLLDPCEKDPVDVIRNLGSQEREDLTSSAQHALRLISYKQIYKILAIKRLPDRERPKNAINGGKRPAQNGDAADGCSDPKKDKKEIVADKETQEIKMES